MCGDFCGFIVIRQEEAILNLSENGAQLAEIHDAIVGIQRGT